MDERILNEMDINELKQLRENILKEEMLKEQYNTEEQNGSENNQEAKAAVKSIGAGSVTGGLSMYPVYDEKKAGKLNIILLAVLSFFFETLFILLSLFIYTR